MRRYGWKTWILGGLGAVLAGCEAEPATEGAVSEPVQQAADTKIVKDTAGKAAENKSLLETPIPEFEGNGKMETVGEINESAVFRMDFDQPYGFYIPESFEEYTLEDGTEWGKDQQRWLLSLFSKEEMEFSANYVNPELAGLDEYAGTERDENGSYYDYFVTADRGHELVIRIHYFEEEMNEALPVFLDVLKTIRYVPDQNH